MEISDDESRFVVGSESVPVILNIWVGVLVGWVNGFPVDNWTFPPTLVLKNIIFKLRKSCCVMLHILDPLLSVHIWGGFGAVAVG